ncbi:hypothetical protein DFP72DRAFT_1068376 [Ephemerocybe angulata]|uniref:Uncharacterized protein n=1 Tax=Ephemerocybe angulata TaxID=980116 RepID=A0A8H6HYU5_9AGAR|nr:hypothetical protein DFP72DRAFT_1068376 [Tulosesus angulatus]
MSSGCSNRSRTSQPPVRGEAAEEEEDPTEDEVTVTAPAPTAAPSPPARDLLAPSPSPGPEEHAVALIQLFYFLSVIQVFALMDLMPEFFCVATVQATPIPSLPESETPTGQATPIPSLPESETPTGQATPIPSLPEPERTQKRARDEREDEDEDELEDEPAEIIAPWTSQDNASSSAYYLEISSSIHLHDSDGSSASTSSSATPSWSEDDVYYKAASFTWTASSSSTVLLHRAKRVKLTTPEDLGAIRRSTAGTSTPTPLSTPENSPSKLVVANALLDLQRQSSSESTDANIADTTPKAWGPYNLPVPEGVSVYRSSVQTLGGAVAELDGEAERPVAFSWLEKNEMVGKRWSDLPR